MGSSYHIPDPIFYGTEFPVPCPVRKNVKLIFEMAGMVRK